MTANLPLGDCPDEEHPPMHSSTHLTTCQCICPSFRLTIHLSIPSSTPPSICACIHLFIQSSVCPFNRCFLSPFLVPEMVLSSGKVETSKTLPQSLPKDPPAQASGPWSNTRCHSYSCSEVLLNRVFVLHLFLCTPGIRQELFGLKPGLC